MEKHMRAIRKVTSVYFRQLMWERGRAHACEVASHDSYDTRIKQHIATKTQYKREDQSNSVKHSRKDTQRSQLKKEDAPTTVSTQITI
jgi:hypothetical protein